MSDKPKMMMLDSTNYNSWKGRMMDLLVCKGFDQPIEDEGIMPTSFKDKESEWRDLVKKAMCYIRRWIDESVIGLVQDETTAIAVWKKLESMYAGKSAGSKVQLIKKLTHMRYVDGTSIPALLTQF